MAHTAAVFFRRRLTLTGTGVAKRVKAQAQDLDLLSLQTNDIEGRRITAPPFSFAHSCEEAGA
jgi:hypothetical protein